MKGIIIYYSLGGNTRKIARAIHKGMEPTVEQCDIVAIKGAKGVPGMHLGHLLEYDLIGIGSPVWRGTIPPNVMAFIDDIPTLYRTYFHKTGYKIPRKKQHAFVFLTHGILPGDAMRAAWAVLKKRGLTIIGWNDWYGAAFMTYMRQPHHAEGHPDDIDLMEAEDFGREMAERSRRIAVGESNLIPKLPTGEAYRRLYGESGYTTREKSRAAWLHHDYKISIDREKCTKCGLCAEHCPMDAIDLDSDPSVLPNCIWCTVCELVCPAGAVDWDQKRYIRDRVGPTEESRESKRHLPIDLHKERQWQMQHEQRLRMLIPDEDVGKDGFVFNIYTKRPRLVIPEQKWEHK